jgi:ribonuclease BN (tRNA processing enzyme)
MKVRFIGTGTTVPHPEHKQSCILLDSGFTSPPIVIDLAGGSLNWIPEWESIRHYLFTHAHVDHIGGLGQLLQSHLFGRPPYDLSEPPPLVHLYGPSSVHAIFEAEVGEQFRTKSLRQVVRDTIEWQTIGDSVTFSIEPDIRVSAYATAHTPDSLGFRIGIGEGTLAFTSDAAPLGRLYDILTGVDLGIVECSLPPGFSHPIHLGVDDVVRILKNLGDQAPKQLVLTHLYPPVLDLGPAILDDVPGKFRNQVILAKDGMEIEI